MKQEDTKQKILEKALELFSTYGYDSVSVGEIAKAVGIKAPSLYNHFPSKQAIFDAIVEATAAQYEKDTDAIDIHVQNAAQDISVFTAISEDALFEKVRQIFFYSLGKSRNFAFHIVLFDVIDQPSPCDVIAAVVLINAAVVIAAARILAPETFALSSE